jgi:hypothetical protein
VIRQQEAASVKTRRALWLAIVGVMGNVAQGADFSLPASGCPMAHCNNQMSNRADIVAPVDGTQLTLISHDTTTAGSNIGLGCSSNGPGNAVACTLDNGSGPNLVVYDGTGRTRWSSLLLSTKAFASAPIVDTGGGIIAADEKVVVRFDAAGNVLWITPTPGGTPISPVIVQGTALFVATKGGPVSLYALNDGHLIGSLTVTDPGTGRAYDTVNTPSVNGSACYVSMQARLNPSSGKLVRVDVDPSGATPLTVKWTLSFGGPSGGSPIYNAATNAIYFDGSAVTPATSGPPVLFAVTDTGTAPILKWTAQLPAKAEATGALDPRGGVWWFAAKAHYVWRFDEANGRVLQTLDINALVNTAGAHVHSSPLVIAQNPQGTPVMILGSIASAGVGPPFIISLDVTPAAGALLWAHKVANSTLIDAGYGQFPIVQTTDGKSRIVFTTYQSGASFLGQPDWRL